MQFDSWQYALFLPAVVLVYYLLPQKLRWVLLLAASYYFYMSWNARLVVLISTTTLVSWGAALLIGRTPSKRAKKLWLATAAVVSLGILFFFKYFDFAVDTIAMLAGRFGLPFSPFSLGLLLPVGISFYTFQTLGYVIDVYRGNLPAEKHFGIYALFVSFFPQLVAGPIERAKNLLPQFRETHTINADAMSWGLRMVCWGLLKKMVIADTAAGYANRVFNNLDGYTPMAYVLGTLLFVVQIYGDFSAYSDIARGSAAMLGFRLMENFRAPYFSKSMQEFWRRWHISLSTWFQDYLYIPLGGSRHGRARHLLNLLITFAVSGLWHGARWNFVLWGVFNGLLVMADSLLAKRRKGFEEHLHQQTNAGYALYATLARLFTFLLVCYGFMLFRCQTFAEIAQITASLPEAFLHPVANMRQAATLLFGGTLTHQLRLMLLGLALLIPFDVFTYRGTDAVGLLAKQRAPVRIAFSYAVAMLVLLAALAQPEGVTVEFIYFQF